MADYEEGFQLADKDATALAQEFFKARLIHQKILDGLNKMSPKVPNLNKHRYLFSHVYEAVNNKKYAFMTMIEILINFPSIPVSTTDTIMISSGHTPELAKILAKYAYKWEMIGTALRFQLEDLYSISSNTCGKPDAIKLSLIKLLDMWIKRECKYTLPPTLRSLELALNSELVGLGGLTCEVRRVISPEMINGTPATNIPLPYVVTSIALPYRNDQCQNVEHAVAEENESILLEVQATCLNEKLTKIEEYQWESDYSLATSITSLPSLCTPAADIDMDGCQLSCAITYTRGSLTQTTRTAAIAVEVHCPLDNIRKELIAKYSAHPEVPKDKWPPISSKKYINLALIKQEPTDYVEKIAQFTIRGDLDDILKDKEIIEYKGLLNSLKSSNVLLIEGRPGSGKTTLVHKITHDWATSPQEYSKTIRSLFLVSLRVLNTIKKPSLELINILQLFKGVNVSKELIEERDGYGVCFIFDGLDEFSPLDGEESIVYKIIKKEYLSKSIVIVASRPVATAHLRGRATKVVEVLGFKKDQIFQYFSHYPFSKKAKPTELNTFLLSHPNILHICYLPIHAVMVAFLFEVKGEVPRTETEIYKHFTNFTVMRNLSKLNFNVKSIHDLSGKEWSVYEQVCRLASEKTILNKQVLYQDEVAFTISKEGDTSLGLITIDRTASLYDIKDVYTFLHLTFQEYLAACHISTLSYKEQLDLIEKYGHKDHMLVVWKFFCGLVKFDTSNNDHRFLILLQKTSNAHLLQIQFAYESQQKTACTQLLKSVKYHIALKTKHLQIPDFTALGYVTSQSVLPVKLTIDDCNINADAMNALAAETEEKYPNFGKIKIVRSFDDSDAVVYFADVLGRCTSLKELDICHEHFNDKMAKTVAAKLKYCKSLEKISISDCSMTSKGTRDVCESLRYSNLKAKEHTLMAQLPSLRFTKLSIDKNKAEFEASLTAIKFLYNDSHELRELVLNGGVLKTMYTAKSVAVYVKHRYCSLQVLDLSDNHCKDQVLKAFVDNFNVCTHPDQDSSLQKLILHSNMITKVGAKALALCLASHYSNLLVLDLDDNMIGNAGAIAIMESLNSLEELYLQNNKIKSEGAKAVASFIQRCHRLHTLRLANNEIGRDGIKALTESFIQCPIMQRLDLGGNTIGVSGVTSIAESLRGSANHLKELHLNDSKIGNHGAEVLSSHLPCYHELNSLSLIKNNIHGIKKLVLSFSQCHNLRKLNLSMNNFGPSEINVLSLGLKNCPSLVELHLADNKIDPDGMQALSSCLLPSSNLKGLNLSNNNIAEAGAEALADSLKHGIKLNWLNLSNNQLDTKAALVIISGINQCPSLRKLNLSYNRISNLQALKKELSHTEVCIVTDHQQ